MNVLIIGTEFLPLPSIKGGAVETLVDFYINYNEQEKNNNITVYSPYFSEIEKVNFSNYKKTTFRYIEEKNNFITKVKKSYIGLKRRLLKNKVITRLYYYEIYKDLKRKKELNRYDIIILENGIRATKLFKEKTKSKIVLHLHNDIINKNINNSYEILKYTDEIWSVSNFIKNRIEEVNNKIKVNVLYNGIDFNNFSENLDEKTYLTIKKKYGIKKNKKYILYSGRLMKEKGVLELIKAYNKLDYNENISLLIIGKPDGINEIATNEYNNKLIEESKKTKNEILFVGKIPYNIMQYFYKIASIQVVPTLVNEAFGMVIIEGMSQKLPIIATEIGAVPELIANDKNGILVNKKNIVNELYETINQLIKDDKKANELGKEGYKTSKKYSKEIYCKTFDTYIKNINK